MFFFKSTHAVVLLLVLTQNILVFASIKDEKNNVEALYKAIIGSMQVPWINRIESVERSSESTCDEEIAAMLNAITAEQTWPLQMLDASSKIQSGILNGNVQDLGAYDQCIAINEVFNGTNVQGKYCTVSFGTLSSAACVPSSCNETDTAELLEAAIQSVAEIIGSELQIEDVTCIPVESEAFTLGEVITIIFFSAVIGFILICTICEFVKEYRTAGVSPVVNELAKFSLYANAMALLNTRVGPRMMPAIQGIRFLSTCWVVLGHRYLNTMYAPLVNSYDIVKWYDSWTAVYIQAAPFAVDTFFVISGFLMTYQFLQSKQSGKRTNYPMMYIHRYLRLTPAIAILALFVAVLLHRVGNGPVWNGIVAQYVGPCQKNWWVTLLYVQNFVKMEEACLPHSWYLAVDMQLFWISPFILYPLYRWPKCGLGILSLLIIGSMVTPAVVLGLNRYTNAALRLDVPSEETLNNFYKYYIPTYNRACAYFVGILLGYEAANKKRNLSQTNVLINWAAACILMLICGLATQRLHNTSLDYDLVLEIVFAVLLRPMWSVANAWIVYACTFGYGGPVTKFLSLPIFLPLSRLTYSIYLVHIVLQRMKVAVLRVPARLSDIILLDQFWADLVLSITVAFFFTLFFESPVIVLEKILTNRGAKPSPSPRPKTDVEGGIDNKAMTIS